MGDYHVSTNEEALGDLWLLENHSINPYIELNDFRPIVDQISSSIDENEFSKERATSYINDQPQERNFPTNPNNIVFVESQECISLHNNYNTNFDGKVSNVSISEQVITPSKGGTRKGFRSSKIKKKKVSEIENFESEYREIIPPEIVERESLAKKRDHNAKERMRRLKLHTTYLALGSLLPPTSRTAQKKWTAPVIMDKVLDYIPELESEIEQLTHKKNKIMSALNENKRTKITKNISNGNNTSSNNYTNNTTKSKVDQALTVSVNEAKQGEVILQICKTRAESKVDSFSNLLQNIEREKNMLVLSASTLFVCDERDCYTIHIQMNESTTSSSSTGCDYITSIKEKFISWLS